MIPIRDSQVQIKLKKDNHILNQENKLILKLQLNGSIEKQRETYIVDKDLYKFYLDIA